MIENVKLYDAGQQFEFDRSQTKDYVLNTVNMGERDTTYSLRRRKGFPAWERDVWYKRMSVIEITGWVIENDREPLSLVKRKVRLNHFVTPNQYMNALCDNGTPLLFLVTESIRYGITESDNNGAFCKFQISGVYRQ